MPHDIGFVDNSGGTLAHYKMLETIRDFAADNGWQVLRYDTAVDNRELILKGAGYSGEEEIFVGFRTYQNADADYYNLTAAAFIGYIPGNAFAAQPGAMLSGIPCHNNRVDYWLTLNQQRIALGMKVGTPVYEHGYVGKFLPYATPSQYPYPVVCGGMLVGEPATRFSDTGHSMPYRGNRASFRNWFMGGTWLQSEVYPWSTGTITSSRDAWDSYRLTPLILHQAAGLYGELDGVCHISGFNNSVENMVFIDGDDWVVLQDVFRTGRSDYIALRMDP